MTMSASSSPTPSPGARRMFKVLCPIARKDGSTFWLRVGTAFPNRDQSFNLYLDALPTNGKLQMREVDEDELRERDPSSPRRRGNLRALPDDDRAAAGDLPF